MPNLDNTTLQMALVGYAAERQKIQAKIDEIKSRLGGRGGAHAGAATTTAPAPRTKRRMSAAARRRIALAQKARWAAYRKKKAA